MGGWQGTKFRSVGIGMTATTLLLLASTVTALVQFGGYLDLSWWVVFAPALAAVGFLLVLMVALDDKSTPPVIRITYITALICIGVAMVMVLLRIQTKIPVLQDQDVFMYIPLWAMSGMFFLLGLLSLYYKYRSTIAGEESKDHVTGAVLIFISLVLTPLLTLIFLRQTGVVATNWALVFLPIWFLDGFSLFTGAFLILFSIGSSSDAIFPVRIVL
eukprot:TRINITY_DN1863_c0_g1_i1.p1 TRINITY_DN1863_c0_g1~~TRINITY_DN1863_c0_g1_i1.p1  ORF type:complete len:216 (+),score=63.11 TRINITY_DN1863_c0_g1_i1:36-683(+)